MAVSQTYKVLIWISVCLVVPFLCQYSIGNIDVKLINWSDARPESDACHSNLQHWLDYEFC